MSRNTSSGVLLGAGAGVATAVALNEANKAYERKQSQLTGLNGDCSSIPCKDGLVCYKNICLDSLPKDGCLKDSDCRGIGQKCINDVCVETMTEEQKQKEIEQRQEQGKKFGIGFGISVGVLLLIVIIIYLYEKYKK
jgi:hypothetical protein